MPRLLLSLLLGCQPDPASPALGDSAAPADPTLACCGELPQDTGWPLNPHAIEPSTAIATLLEPITIYTVRHAEKESEGSDPGLTPEGLARAEALADLMNDVPLTDIYATTLTRTQETVAPTAERHNLPINIDFDPEDELAQHIRVANRGDTVLHAGHSYTLGGFMDALGVEELPDHFDYGDLWIITLMPNGEVRIVESHYGE